MMLKICLQLIERSTPFTGQSFFQRNGSKWVFIFSMNRNQEQYV